MTGTSYKKSNVLINAEQLGETVLGHQLFILGLKELYVDDNNRVIATVTCRDFKDALGHKSDSIYARVKRFCERSDRHACIYDWKVKIKDSLSGKTQVFDVVDEAAYQDGIVKITYNKALSRLLINLKNNYTVLSFSEVMNLSGTTAIRLYEILMALCAGKEKAREYEWGQLQNTLGTDLSKAAIRKAVQELNEKTRLEVSINENDGRIQSLRVRKQLDIC